MGYRCVPSCADANVLMSTYWSGFAPHLFIESVMDSQPSCRHIHGACEGVCESEPRSGRIVGGRVYAWVRCRKPVELGETCSAWVCVLYPTVYVVAVER